MFESGAQLKKQYGEDAVCDFSLGNPDLPAPPAVADGLRTLLAKAHEPFAFGYMPNGGFAWARERLATYLSAEQGVALTGDDLLLSCGAAGGLNAFLRAVIEPGEKVGRTGTAVYGHLKITAADGTVVSLPVIADAAADEHASRILNRIISAARNRQ